MQQDSNFTASQHTSQAGEWTTGQTGSQAADDYARDATDRARNVREQQLNQMSNNQQQHEGSGFTRDEELSAPTGYFTRQSKGGRESGPGNEVSAFQHTTEAGNWTTGETGSEAAHTYESDAKDRARQVREQQIEQGALQNANDLQVLFAETCMQKKRRGLAILVNAMQCRAGQCSDNYSLLMLSTQLSPEVHEQHIIQKQVWPF